MRTIRLIVLAILVSLSSHVVAQMEPGKQKDLASVHASDLIQSSELPDHPQPHKVIDKKFIAVMGGLAATETMRFTTRHLVIENEMAAGAPG